MLCNIFTFLFESVGFWVFYLVSKVINKLAGYKLADAVKFIFFGRLVNRW